MKILRVDELPWQKIDPPHRTVFVRVDFNVPLFEGTVTDDYRIRQAVPTIRYLLEQKCIVILASHLGRPKPQDPKSLKKLTLLPVAKKLAEILDQDVLFYEGHSGDGLKKLVSDGRGGKTVILLENLRFDPREEANEKSFAEELMQEAHLYVNDAFGASHRAHASIEAITHLVQKKAMGFLLAKEWEVLNQVLHHPKRPQYAVLGGAKIADKISVIENLMKTSSALFVGGRMGLTFLAAQGWDLGASSVETESIPVAKRILVEAKKLHVNLYFPVDGRAADKMDATEAKLVSLMSGERVPAGLAVYDIGPRTTEIWGEELKKAASIVWNGPLGVFENPVFAEGTLSLVNFLLSVKDRVPAITGGGETVSAVTQRGALKELFHVSTGGGAMLEFLEGQALPGFESLKYRDREIEAMNALEPLAVAE